MQVTVQVVTLPDDGQETLKDIACVERQALTPETFGLALAEGKAVLQALQEVVVEGQMQTYLPQHRACPHCGKARRGQGVHHTVFRTVFGTLPGDSPRRYHCACQAHATPRCRPLATLLPAHTPPALLSLATTWAALMSYGLMVKLLQDVLPIDAPLEAVTMRNHGLTVAQRLEDALGAEQWSFLDKCPAEVAELPMPHGPLTVGIDGGYVKAQGEQGTFAVIAGKSLLALHRGAEAPEPVSSTCVACGPTSAQQPQRRLCAVLQSQGHQLNQQLTFLSEGGETVRDLQLYLNPQAEHLLDWFHVTNAPDGDAANRHKCASDHAGRGEAVRGTRPGHQGIGTPQMVPLAWQCVAGRAGDADHRGGSRSGRGDQQGCHRQETPESRRSVPSL